jgi:predicted metal-dependent hydrolase
VKTKRHQCHYGENSFSYHLVYKANNSTKRTLIINVHPSGMVDVVAPEDTTLKQVKEGVQKRARWVVSNLEEIDKRNKDILPREYVSGEMLFYLGRRYQLKVDKRLKGEDVKLYRGKIVVPGRGKKQEEIRDLLVTWYREKARKVFEKRLAIAVNKPPWVKEEPKWKMIKMKRQWGSCSPKGVLSLNPELVKAPTVCIDYVLLHELCHLKEHNHSKRFYSLLDTYMVNWEATKSKLDDMSELILNN